MTKSLNLSDLIIQKNLFEYIQWKFSNKILFRDSEVGWHEPIFLLRSF